MNTIGGPIRSMVGAIGEVFVAGAEERAAKMVGCRDGVVTATINKRASLFRKPPPVQIHRKRRGYEHLQYPTQVYSSTTCLKLDTWKHELFGPNILSSITWFKLDFGNRNYFVQTFFQF